MREYKRESKVTNKPDNQLKISVMFITYNRKNELLRAIKSCLDQNFEQMEIVIVDNHSTDNTQESVVRLLNDNQIAYNYFYSERNLGVSAGRNKAFSLCHGKYVLCLDDDAVLDSNDFLTRAYNEMEKEKDAVAASVEIYEPENQHFLDGLRYYNKGREWAFSYIGAAHLLRTSYFRNKTLYPPTFRFGSEEYYVAYGIWKDHKRMLHVKDLRVLHMPSVVARVYGKERDTSIIINNYIVRIMCYPNICRVILNFTLFFRMIKHGLINKEDLRSIKRSIRERYCDEYVNRMSLRDFCRMIYFLGINNCI